MSAEQEVYPHASKGGVAIPFDIGDPIGSFISTFTAVMSAEFTLGANAEDQIAIIYATEDMLLMWDGDTDDDTGTFVEGQLIVLSGRTVAVPVGALTFKIEGISASGSMYMQIFRKWQTLDKSSLMGRT